MTRDELGEMVRNVWIQWAKEQPEPKPSWLVPYSDLSEEDKEADRMIGEALFHRGAMRVLLAQTSYPVEIRLRLKYKDLTIEATRLDMLPVPPAVGMWWTWQKGQHSEALQFKAAGYASGVTLWAECEHDFSDTYLADEELGIQVRAMQKRGWEKVEVIK